MLVSRTQTPFQVCKMGHFLISAITPLFFCNEIINYFEKFPLLSFSVSLCLTLSSPSLPLELRIMRSTKDSN